MLKAQRPKNKTKGVLEDEKWGLKAVSLGPKVALNCSKVETRCEDEGVRPGKKGLSHLDSLVDPAWICA